MTRLTRRQLFQSLAATGIALPALNACSRQSGEPRSTAEDRKWGFGYEDQRVADRGDGTFLNPIFAGDHPDPAIIRDGDVYYVTFSTFEAYPGLMIYRSYDLVNWEPVAPALNTYIGSVWAPDLVLHQGRYYLYIPARTEDYRSIYVITADTIEGPWSEPVDLFLPDHIDPGHIVGEDGKRYLFLSNGDMIRLTDDGLATDGEVAHIYDPWRYPESWDVECFCPEGPKMLRKDGWFYMLTAVGGTAGPPTSHMVISARSRSVHGPWEHAPNNPQVRTLTRDEQWWSRGHATLIDGPNGDWWLISHGYENGYWTLGRQALLEPVRWREDGWWESLGGDLSSAFPIPAADKPLSHGAPHSDNFAGDRLSDQWRFFRPSRDEYERITLLQPGLSLEARGESPENSSPLCFVAGDLSYEVTVEMRRDTGNEAGLLAFYNDQLYAGLAFNDHGLLFHRYGMARRRAADIPAGTETLFVRMKNDEHVLTFYFSLDGEIWSKMDVQMEVSGYHHNVAYGFLSLRPGIYSSREGAARFYNLQYRTLRNDR